MDNPISAYEPVLQHEASATSLSHDGVTQTDEGINGPFPKELDHWNWGAFF